LLEDIGGLAEENQLMEEHEEYPGSLKSMEGCDPETQEDVHVSQGLPFMKGFETVGYTHAHGDSRARGSYEDTSTCVPGLADLHVEVFPIVHLGYMSMQGHTVMSGNSQRHAEVYSGIQGDTLDCGEETYLVEHGDSSPLQQYIGMGDHLHSRNNCMSDDRWRVIDQQFVELQIVVPDGWSLVMSTGDHSPWVPVDELLVKSLGLTKVYDTFQWSIQLQLFLLSFLDTFIIDISIREDRQWHGTWRVGRQRPPDRSD
jgi:hypothetical protein